LRPLHVEVVEVVEVVYEERLTKINSLMKNLIAPLKVIVQDQKKTHPLFYNLFHQIQIKLKTKSSRPQGVYCFQQPQYFKRRMIIEDFPPTCFNLSFSSSLFFLDHFRSVTFTFRKMVGITSEN